jgi:SAM-dependent methyltransferase
MATLAEIPQDWYRSAYPPAMDKLPWADKTVSEVDRLITMLNPSGSELILDLGCGTGRHSLELAQRGFSVTGVELLEANVQVARDAAEMNMLDIEFVQADLRELEFEEQFDLVLSFNDGAIGYFETEAENMRTFEVIARALKRHGRHWAQTPNVLFAERFLPEKTWIEGDETLELTDHWWNHEDRRMEGTTAAITIGDTFHGLSPLPYRARLYTIDELRDIYVSLRMSLTNTFRGDGKRGRPRPNQYEIFWEARKEQP